MSEESKSLSSAGSGSSPPAGWDPALEALWQQVLTYWGEDAPHDAFLQAAREKGQLGAAAGRYREMASDEERRDRAEEKLSAIFAMALTQLSAKRPSQSPVRRKISLLAWCLGGLILLLIAGLVRAMVP